MRTAQKIIERIDALQDLVRQGDVDLPDCVGVEEPHTLAVTRGRHHAHDYVKPGGLSHHYLAMQLGPGRMMRIDTAGRSAGHGRAGLTNLMIADELSVWRSDAPVRYLGFFLRKEFIEGLAADAFGVAEARVTLRPAQFELDPYIARIADIAQEELLEGEAPPAAQINAWGTLIGMHILRTYSNVTRSAPDMSRQRLSPRQLRQAVDFIHTHLDGNPTLREVAEAVDMTQFHFARAFRTTMGFGVHQYLIKARLEEAQTLIQKTGLSLTEIAYRVGFSSQSHMTSWFRRRLGFTPKRFRKSCEY